MNIGEEQETVIVEPVEDPFRRERPEPAPEKSPERTPERTPEKVPA